MPFFRASLRARPGARPSFFSGFLATVLAVTAILGMPDRDEAVAAPVQVVRIAGADRYDTAARISAATFGANVPVAYIATGNDYQDALAGPPRSAVSGGPLLLVTRTSVPRATATELARVKPQKIVVLGGPSAVDQAVLSALARYAVSGSVTRLAGQDRYGTATAVSATYPTGSSVAYLATGTAFPDALSGAPSASGSRSPILLTMSSSLPAVTARELQRLKPGRIVILGGTGAVNLAVASAASKYTAGGVSRVGGANRYATSAAISRATFTSAKTVYIASGERFPDALAGGAAAGRTASPLLLVQHGSLPAAIRDELKRLNPTRVVILGGAAAVSDAVAISIQSALGGGGTGNVVSGAYNLGFAPDPAAIDRFAKVAGRAPGLVHYYQSWGRDFQPTHANTVVSRGAAPLISWEPWGGLDASGKHDAYVRSYARAVKSWAGSVYLRVGHEMNLNLFPWSDPAKFVAGWRRMVDIFRAEGATNAKFVWCPNVTYGGYFPMREYFPGSNYVDWLCLDGYNFGSNRRSGWESFDQLFGYSINQITGLAPGKPLMIGEFSSAEQGGSKADWITNAFGTAIKKYPAIRAVVWFNEDYASQGQADWRLETSQSAIDAYRRAMTDPYYHGKMP